MPSPARCEMWDRSLRVGSLLDVQSGAPRPYPVDSDCNISGERIVENASSSLQDIADLGQVILTAWQYSSRIIRLSTSLAQDFGYDIEAYLGERFGIRIARVANQDFTTGTGSADGQPMGFVTAVVNAGGTVTAVGSAPNDGVGGAGTIGVDDLANLESLLDPLHRMSPSCAWQMHPSTLQALEKWALSRNPWDGPDLLISAKIADWRRIETSPGFWTGPDIGSISTRSTRRRRR